jgi:hypothetical protein
MSEFDRSASSRGQLEPDDVAAHKHSIDTDGHLELTPDDREPLTASACTGFAT